MTISKKIKSQLPEEYEVADLENLGGGQASVYKGKYRGDDAAIKIFNFDNQANQQRVRRELELLSRISCETLVKVLGFSEIKIDGYETFIVAYEYYKGGDLRAKCDGSCEEREICQIGLCVSRAIDELWSKRVVHRDIKPENIVNASTGRYVLVDLGLAQHLDLSTLTPMQFAPGTQGYRAPEQLAGRRSLTYKSDIFSLGVALYELASGKHPYGRMETMVGVYQPRSISHFRKSFNSDLNNILISMLATSPSRRPRNLTESLTSLIEEL